MTCGSHDNPRVPLIHVLRKARESSYSSHQKFLTRPIITLAHFSAYCTEYEYSVTWVPRFDRALITEYVRTS